MKRRSMYLGPNLGSEVVLLLVDGIQQQRCVTIDFYTVFIPVPQEVILISLDSSIFSRVSSRRRRFHLRLKDFPWHHQSDVGTAFKSVALPHKSCAWEPPGSLTRK